MQTRWTMAFLLLAACGTGSTGPAGQFGSADEADAVCGSVLSITGLHQRSQPPQEADPGCSPAGLWQLQVVDTGQPTETGLPACSVGQVQVQQIYTYQVTVDVDRNQTIIYEGDLDENRNNMKITGNGSSCALSAEHVSPDGQSFVNLKPFADESGQLLPGSKGEAFLLQPFR